MDFIYFDGVRGDYEATSDKKHSYFRRAKRAAATAQPERVSAAGLRLPAA